MRRLIIITSLVLCLPVGSAMADVEAKRCRHLGWGFRIAVLDIQG